ncbi:MAG: CapA family protein [Verrucomicrobiota bacterium]|nr:CapA family protein [Verrucomicrobiota bacterium]
MQNSHAGGGAQSSDDPRAVKLFLCGDVMTGRGIDQILPYPGDPVLYESYMRSALGYVELAEHETGPLPRRVDSRYIWGDALALLEEQTPDARIVNLETSVTASHDAWPGKGIHYRMHPANVACLTAARIDCCTLANNHVLDWGYAGLRETLSTLHRAGIRTAGAGLDEADAAAPSIIELAGKSRVLIFAFGMTSAGVPPEWGASATRPGVSFLPDLSARASSMIADRVREHKQAGDVAVLSIHWGGNWGYDVSAEQREFAHRLVDGGLVEVVFGHSSHHPKGIEIYRDRPILYGCGDFLNDYEGIGGNESFRPDLTAAYFATIDARSGRLIALELAPMQIRHLRVNRASDKDARWLAQTLDREGRRLGTTVSVESNGRLVVRARSS